jgi:hypothetical protein
MGEGEPHWTDNPDFQWRPDAPYRTEPQFAGSSPFVERRADSYDNPSHKPAPTYHNARLAIGALQGLGLALLSLRHGDSGLTTAEGMVLLFAPAILLAGLGRMPGRFLLPWTLIASILLAALGAYQAWREFDAAGTAFGQPASVIAIAAIALFLAHVLIIAWAKDAMNPTEYVVYHDSAWSLALQLLICVIGAVIVGVGIGLSLRFLRPPFPAACIALPCATIAAAYLSGWLSPARLRLVAPKFLDVLTLALPVIFLLAAAMVLAALLHRWLPPLLMDLVLAAGLLLGINASHRAGEERPAWRLKTEFAAALAMAPLLLLGMMALHVRVAQLGWTSPRIFAAVCLAVLSLYALAYTASALLSLGGGRWMQDIEIANIAMAFGILILLLALASPVADPLRLAAQSQATRLRAGQRAPADFDFIYLKSSSRFGRQALADALAPTQQPPSSHTTATIRLPAPPAAKAAQIGPNIHVRGTSDPLPAGLLTRDWSNVPGAPACLTNAARDCDAYFMDLDNDGRDEIVLVQGDNAAWQGVVMKRDKANWYPVATLASTCPGSLEALRRGRYDYAEPLGWLDLLVGGKRLTVTPVSPAKSTGCSP